MSARRISLAASAALACLLLGAPAAQAESSDVVDADVELELANDASLLVTERLRFEYDGSFQASYRDIPLLHQERITDVGVSEGGMRYQQGGNTAFGSIDTPGRFGVTPYGNGVRIVWHHGATDEARIFEITYRVIGAAVAHDDVIDVGWTVWGDQWGFDLEQLSASLANPALDPDDPLYRVWGHVLGDDDIAERLDGETVRGDGVASLEAVDVPDGTAVEMRVTLPRSAVQTTGGARVETGEGLPAIVEFEQQLTDDFNGPWPSFKRWVADNVLLASLALGALIVGLLALLSLLAREHRTDVPEHIPEPPDGADPAVAYALAHEGDDSTNTVLATLLDLTDRGYYQTGSASTGEEKLDLALSVNPQRPAGELAAHEIQVLSFFDELLGGDEVALSDMRDRIPKHSATWRGRWESMTEALDAAEEGQLSWDRDFTRFRAFGVLAVLLLFGALIVISLSEDGGFVIPAIVGVATFLVTVMWPSNRLRRMTPEHGERSARWQSFERWTEDFPRLDDDPPATLDLWKRILVFGVAFGTADRMIASGRIPAPVTESASTGAHWSAYAFTGGLADSSFNGTAFSSGFSSQVAAPASSSSGGGGGFSGGGGGGFSGGGGGGSW